MNAAWQLLIPPAPGDQGPAVLKDKFHFKSSINGLVAGEHADPADPLVAEASREIYASLLGRLNGIC